MTDTRSPLAGTRLVVPPGALGSAVTVRISEREATPPFTPPMQAAPAGPALTLEPEGLTFAEPVALTVPYSPDGLQGTAQIVVVSFDAQGVPTCLITTAIDSAAARVTVAAEHFSVVGAWQVDPATTQGGQNTSFDIATDVLSLVNPQPGYCAGMCNLALWYFRDKKPDAAYGALRHQRTDSRERELAVDAQDAVGDRACPPESDLPSDFSYALNTMIHIDRGVPPILGLWPDPPGPNPEGHVVIADRWRYEATPTLSIWFGVYDPNHPDALGVACYDLHTERLTFPGCGGGLRISCLSTTPIKPTALNTVLHAGTWYMTGTIDSYYGFPPESPPGPELTPFTWRLAPVPGNECMVQAVWHGLNPNDTLLYVGLITDQDINVVSERYWFQVPWWDPDLGLIYLDAYAELTEMHGDYANDLEMTGTYAAAGGVPALGMAMGYSGTFHGVRPEEPARAGKDPAAAASWMLEGMAAAMEAQPGVR